MAVARPEREVIQDAAAAMHVAAERVIVQERLFNAPRELVWEAWTHPPKPSRWTSGQAVSGGS